MKRVVYNIREFWQDICRWLAYFKIIRKTYDFDFSSLLEVELHQLTKLRDSIAKYHTHTNAWYDIRNMNWAIECLRIFINDDECNWVDGKPILKRYVNCKNIDRFFDKNKYDNIPDNSEIILNLEKEQLYIRKAWHLYNKIRKEHLIEWWD